MEQNKALEILVQGVTIAQSKGVYTLSDAKIIAEAVEVFTKKEEPVEEVKEVKED